jgi:hypothetical protein
LKRWLPLFALLILPLAAFGCGGDDDDPKIDQDTAEDIAEKALLAETHLPGNNWQETARDDFAESDDFPETEACEELNEFFEDLDDGDEPLAATNVTFERAPTGDAPIPFEVEAEIEVHEGTSEDINLGEEAEQLLEDANFDDCMEDFVAQVADEIGAEGEYERRDPGEDAPGDGFAMSFVMRLTLQGQEFEAVGELYIWNDQHVQSQISFIGTEGQMQTAPIGDILDEAEDRVRAAQE